MSTKYFFVLFFILHNLAVAYNNSIIDMDNQCGSSMNVDAHIICPFVGRGIYIFNRPLRQVTRITFTRFTKSIFNNSLNLPNLDKFIIESEYSDDCPLIVPGDIHIQVGDEKFECQNTTTTAKVTSTTLTSTTVTTAPAMTTSASSTNTPKTMKVTASTMKTTASTMKATASTMKATASTMRISTAMTTSMPTSTMVTTASAMASSANTPMSASSTTTNASLTNAVIGTAISAALCLILLVTVLIAHKMKIIKLRKLRLGDISLSIADTSLANTTDTSFNVRTLTEDFNYNPRPLLLPRERIDETPAIIEISDIHTLFHHPASPFLHAHEVSSKK